MLGDEAEASVTLPGAVSDGREAPSKFPEVFSTENLEIGTAACPAMRLASPEGSVKGARRGRECVVLLMVVLDVVVGGGGEGGKDGEVD